MEEMETERNEEYGREKKKENINVGKRGNQWKHGKDATWTENTLRSETLVIERKSLLIVKH